MCGVIQEDDDLSPNTSAAPAAIDAPARHHIDGASGVKQATSDALLGAVIASLEDDKAEDVVQIDLRGKTEICDYMVICTGRSTRQVSAISEKLAQTIKDEFGRTPKVEGKDTGDWVLIDTGDVVVHVFRPEVREFYQLEKMWMDGGEVAAPQN